MAITSLASGARVEIQGAPFDPCDREADYAIAWAAFERRVPSRTLSVRGLV